jgi:hypothetical protein
MRPLYAMALYFGAYNGIADHEMTVRKLLVEVSYA